MLPAWTRVMPWGRLPETRLQATGWLALSTCRVMEWPTPPPIRKVDGLGATLKVRPNTASAWSGAEATTTAGLAWPARAPTHSWKSNPV